MIMEIRGRKSYGADIGMEVSGTGRLASKPWKIGELLWDIAPSGPIVRLLSVRMRETDSTRADTRILAGGCRRRDRRVVTTTERALVVTRTSSVLKCGVKDISDGVVEEDDRGVLGTLKRGGTQM
jgi:hypothetical protein